MPFEEIERFEFYERAKKAFAVVVTGETALYANLMLKKVRARGEQVVVFARARARVSKRSAANAELCCWALHRPGLRPQQAASSFNAHDNLPLSHNTLQGIIGDSGK